MEEGQSWPKIFEMENMPYWLKGGIAGLLVCVVLFLFYVFLYFPLFTDDTTGTISNKALVLPMITGQGFLILSHFIIPSGFLCEDSVKECTGWSVEENLPEDYVCDPLVRESVEGCCTSWTYYPTDTCSILSERVGFFGLMIFLLGIYFMAGALIFRMMYQRKTKR